MDRKTADRRRSRLHGLVLVRAVDLANFTSKLAVRYDGKSGFIGLHPIYNKINDERGP